MKAHNLDAVVASFQAAGARCAVVSGVVDAGHGVHADLLPRAALTVCRLRIDRHAMRQRFIGRGAQIHQVAEVLREADDLDRSGFADACVDTSGLPVAEVTRLVRERTGRWPVRTDGNRPPEAPQPGGQLASATDGPVLWLCGATGVGKSQVGWEIYHMARRAGLAAAFIDLDQVGFCRPVPAEDPHNHQVKARNVAALWHTYRAAGAQCLVIVGPVGAAADVTAYTTALPAANVTLCRLHAGRDQLTQRIMRRGQGHNWSAPGDPLTGQPTVHLLQVAAKAVADAEALERAAIGDLCIDTDGRTAEQVADAIVAQTGGWPSLVPRSTERQ